MLDLYGDYIDGDKAEGKALFVPLEVVRQNIKDAPSVEKTGKWVKAKNTFGEEMDITVCSECSAIIKQEYLDYCAKCGARMVNEDESNS